MFATFITIIHCTLPFLINFFISIDLLESPFSFWQIEINFWIDNIQKKCNKRQVKMEEGNVTNNISCHYNWTEEQSEVLASIEWVLEGPGSLAIGSSGILVNSFAIFVILSSDLKTSFFYWLLVCLEIFDSCFLGCCVLESFRKHIGTVSVHNLIFANFLSHSKVLWCFVPYT